MSIYNKEYRSGAKMENKLKLLIEKDLNKPLKSTYRYCSYDFYDDDTIVELKNRRTRSTDYDTTILTTIKAENMMNIDKERLLYINFLDGLFKCHLDDELLKNSKKGITKRYDRGRVEIRDCYYVPMDHFVSV